MKTFAYFSIKKLWPFGLLFAVVGGLFSPLLFGGKIIPGEEDIGAYYPMMFFYQTAVRSGSSFLWNNFYYGGFPTYLNILGGFFYPLHYVLFKYLPLFSAYHLAIFIAACIGVFFCYLFGRANSFSKIGSLIFALSYLLSQTMDGITTTLAYANGFLLLPLLSYSLLKVKQSDRFSKTVFFILLGSAGCGIGFLAGFTQVVLYSIAFAFFYSLFLDWPGIRLSSWFRSLRSTRSFVLMVLGGALLGLPQIIATAEFVNLSVRTARYSAEVSTWPHITYFLTYLLPDTVRIPVLTSGTAGLYIGVLPLLFFTMTVFFFRTKESKFFLVSYVLIFLMAIRFPGIGWINDSLPIFSRISHVGRWLLVGAFPLSFLAAYGYENLLRQPPDFFSRKSFSVFLKIVTFASFLIVFAGIIGNAVLYILMSRPVLKEALLSFLVRGRSLQLPYAHYQNVFDTALQSLFDTLSLTNWRFTLPIILFPVASFTLSLFSRSVSRRWFGPVSLSLVIVNICIAFGAYFKELVPQSVLAEAPGIVRTIKGRERTTKSFRIMPFLTGEALFREVSSHRELLPSELAHVQKEMLVNNISTIYNLETMAGFEPLRPLRHFQLIDTLVGPNHAAVFDGDAVKRGARLDQAEINEEALRHVSVSEKSSDFLRRLGILSMMNVKYVISFYPLDDSRLQELPLDAALATPLSLHLYENKLVMPRIYFAKNPMFWAGSDRELLSTVSETDDFTKKTFIECPDCSFHAGSGKNQISILHSENGFLELSSENENGGWLVVSNSDVPGWEATVDSFPARIYTANYIFQSIYVPKGKHAIRFEYIGTFRQTLRKIGVLVRR